MKPFDFSGARPAGRGLRLAVAALAVAVTTAGGAVAQPAGESYRVTFRDLDTATPEGASALMRRIQYAAGRVCGDDMILDLTQRAHIHKCRVEAIDRAVKDAQVPMLATIARRSSTMTLAGE